MSSVISVFYGGGGDKNKFCWDLLVGICLELVACSLELPPKAAFSAAGGGVSGVGEFPIENYICIGVYIKSIQRTLNG